MIARLEDLRRQLARHVVAFRAIVEDLNQPAPAPVVIAPARKAMGRLPLPDAWDDDDATRPNIRVAGLLAGLGSSRGTIRVAPESIAALVERGLR